MSVVRRRHNGNFVTIPNRVLDDKCLSLEAKGMLCWLLARPNDWTFKLALIGPLLGIGRDKTEKLFRQLIEAGFVDRIQERVDGRWGAVEYVVFDEPQSFGKLTSGANKSGAIDHHDAAASPHPEKPVPAEPVPADQGALIKQKDTKTADDAGAREPAKSLISPEAYALCDELMHLQHLDKHDPRCIGTAYGVQAWLSKGWKAEVIHQAVATVMARTKSAPRSLRYFEPAIADAHAERDRPLPVATPFMAIHSNNRSRIENGTHRNGGFIRAAIRLAQQAPDG